MNSFPIITDAILKDEDYIKINNIVLNENDPKEKQISFIVNNYSNSIKFKRKLIENYINNIISSLSNKSAYITYDIIIENVSTKPKIKNEIISSKSKRWTDILDIDGYKLEYLYQSIK